MQIAGRAYRSIWTDPETGQLTIIDQTELPEQLVLRPLPDLASVAEAIRSMRVRGAPLIGATAAQGIALALHQDPSDAALTRAAETLLATRPTAVNLRWAVERMLRAVGTHPVDQRAAAARVEAAAICDEDVAICQAIGEAGWPLLRRLHAEKGAAQPLQILTHCNAGWLATVDWGTALAPIFKSHAQGLPLHVWVDETRPRNQGAALTAFELREQGIPHTVIVDNAGGHLMQQGRVDLVLVGSDRTTATGDVCNKIGTYLKALAAKDNDVPFYVALPSSTIDWSIEDGRRAIPIEERGPEEVRSMRGRTEDGVIETIEIVSMDSPVANPAFDVTPSALVSGLVTEFGIVAAPNAESMRALRVERGS